MREIKFRAWNDSEKKMCRVLMIWPGDTAIGMQFIDDDKRITLATTASKEGVELMQSTGLKDKNKKEIWEKDIISAYWNPDVTEKFIIVWDDETGAWGYVSELKEIEPDQEGKTNVSPLGYDQGEGQFPRFENIEVIGNIYESPELLNIDKEIKRLSRD